MTNTTDYRADLERIRRVLATEENNMSEGARVALCEDGMYSCVLVAEDNCQMGGAQWENSELARECSRYAKVLADHNHELEMVQTALGRIFGTLELRPRLGLELLEQRAEVLRTLGGHAEELEEVEAKAKVFSHNIAAADKGRLKDVEQMGFLKRDPVEWTARWEEVIDSVEQQVAEQLAGEPMGMGYCFGYWSAKAAVLADQYGIQWRSPSAMNPRVMFD
ncbi:MAG: hypothetical protein E7134_07030 [Rikenellaceae bacterium]|nr:hypothetical protein [Rikenellaceae bacterium]